MWLWNPPDSNNAVPDSNNALPDNAVQGIPGVLGALLELENEEDHKENENLD